MRCHVQVCGNRERVCFKLLSPRTSAERSGEATLCLLGQVVEGCRERLCTLLHGAKLRIGGRLGREGIGFE